MLRLKGDKVTSTGSGAACASLIGRTLGGHEVLALIGRGAMGTVYLAEDKSLQRYVALKVLLGNLARNPSLVKSLQLEAKAAAPLQHPNIVRIYSAGIDQGIPYIAMEYVEGEPLDRFLKRNNRLHWTAAFHIGLQVAEALRYTHSRGVIHRDVKPANVLLDRHGRARLTDFGIANIQADEGDLAEASGFLGTPHYMSPEQCEGRPVSGASDVYSLGVTLYQMITGELPFTADSPMALIKSIVSEPAPRVTKLVPDVPDDVARLVSHLLQKRPEDRPVNAEEVCRSMARLQQEGGGKSALSSALNAFIREQAQIRTLPVVAQREAERRAPRGFVRRLKRKLTEPPARIVGTIAVVVLCAMGPIVGWHLNPIHGSALSAPALSDAVFSKPGAAVRIARFSAEGYRVDGVAWVCDERVVLARAKGIEGALTQGASGLFAVDPLAQRAWSVHPPTGGVFDPATPLVRGFESWSLASPNAPAGTPLHDVVLAEAVNTEQGHVALVAQKYGEAAPRSEELYRAALPEPSEPGPIRGVSASPDGYTVCLLLRDPLGGGDFLAERDTRWDTPDRVGPCLSPREGRVLPESVQYAPDGAYIVFTVEKNPSLRELWTVPSGGSVDRAVKLKEGALLPGTAISPDGRRIAVATNAGAEIVVLDAATGAVEGQLGPGIVGPQSWHPSGAYLVVTAADEGNTVFVPWAVEAAAPYRRVHIDAPEDVTGACAVSHDGAWVAAIAEGTPELTTVFMRLNTVHFDG